MYLDPLYRLPNGNRINLEDVTHFTFSPAVLDGLKTRPPRVVVFWSCQGDKDASIVEFDGIDSKYMAQKFLEQLTSDVDESRRQRRVRIDAMGLFQIDESTMIDPAIVNSIDFAEASKTQPARVVISHGDPDPYGHYKTFCVPFEDSKKARSFCQSLWEAACAAIDARIRMGFRVINCPLGRAGAYRAEAMRIDATRAIPPAENNPEFES
jgi:hypothetical protein